ncbi:MAG: putative zinc metalloprotease [Streblomastix strix]|uniref:Putative zinc metalloprotease n=1 Tax=Streblomastix strix TaxID=222440 RepID=A0A5J4W205_9EUKA|nr:MAG: putative zinc metalloprotease [Streblomastix strix]
MDLQKELFVQTSTAQVGNRIIQTFSCSLPYVGITVHTCDMESPMTYSYISFATKGRGNSGELRRLEHLIFFGSDKCKRGKLDDFAIKCLSNGTNSWTATDHSCYTTKTAGYEEMNAIFPVYIHYFLFLTLTTQAFATDVHHIDEEGKDNGVVYNEMQSYYAVTYWISFFALNQLQLEQNFPVSYETGGLIEYVRKLTLEEVREFHKMQYKPENIEVIQVVIISVDKLLKGLYSIVNEINERFEKMNLPQFKRPFLEKAEKAQI